MLASPVFGPQPQFRGTIITIKTINIKIGLLSWEAMKSQLPSFHPNLTLGKTGPVLHTSSLLGGRKGAGSGNWAPWPEDITTEFSEHGCWVFRTSLPRCIFFESNNDSQVLAIPWHVLQILAWSNNVQPLWIRVSCWVVVSIETIMVQYWKKEIISERNRERSTLPLLWKTCFLDICL